MTDDELRARAERAGIATSWFDVSGNHHEIGVPTLRSVLEALALVEGEQASLPPLVTADRGLPPRLPVAAAKYELQLGDGRSFSGVAIPERTGCTIPAILESGYHHLTIGGKSTVVAVAPERGFTVAEACPGRRAFGIAAQLYSLRRSGDAGIGDFAALADFARAAAGHGADAVAISPVHAQFSADPDRFSPYAPSSRVALNVLHCAVDEGADAAWAERAAALEARTLVDWPAAARARLARLRSIFATSRGDPEIMQRFHEFRRARGETLELHARFEALHAHFFHGTARSWHWRHWPPAYRDPGRPEVASFARDCHGEVDFHAFLQFLADRGLAQAQSAAREAGMAIGLITDLAVGVDSGGSQAWSQQGQTLGRLTIGAPPDLFQPRGQNWGLTAFSPHGLVRHGFGAYLEMLRTALAHAGGVRIDHAMGMERLWIIPDGADSGEGTYLAFPRTDLLRLLALESARHRAVILAEDLGTVPEGFREALSARGVLGMRVLWFERDTQQRFTSPATWPATAAAMTSTHDLPTVSGWWQGTDIGWRSRLGEAGENESSVRATDRALLWRALQNSGAAEGEMPAPDAAPDVAAAACAHVAGSPCALCLLPVEDVLGLPEQPNMPNTIDQHPNWRRRLDAAADRVLDDAATVLHRVAAGVRR